MLRVWMREAEKKAKEPTASEQGTGDGAKGRKGKGKGGKDKKGKGKKKGEKGGGKKASEEGASAFGTIRREGWPKDRPDYLYFRLYKENCDTGEAVSSIARCVGRSVKQFTFAGTKDKRAATVQQICAHRLPADQLRRTVLHRLWDKRLRICALEYRKDRLRLGQLRGNRFRIVLRNVPAEIFQAADATEGSKDSLGALGLAFQAAGKGFLNYFGLQRFGTREVKTHRVGAAIIAGRWEAAAHLILGCKEGKRPAGPTEVERPSKLPRLDDASDKSEKPQEQGQEGKGCNKGKQKLVSEAQRVYLETGDAQRALDIMPRSQHLERCILGAMARGLPFAETLSQLPHQAVSLYAHAAQSLVWNAVLSRRIRTFGRQPVEGDLVFQAEGQEAEAMDEILDCGEDDASEEDAAVQESNELPAVRILGKEDLEGVKLTDVVLPLPGFDVVYPPYLKATYEEVSQSLLGLSLTDFSECTMVRLSGSYRAVAVCPKDLEWSAVPPEKLESWDQVLLETDVARLLAERPQTGQQEAKPSDLSAGVNEMTASVSFQ